MRAVVYSPAGVRVTDAPEPKLSQPGDVLVRVTHTAVCGTDLHLLSHPDQLQPGTVMGHEFVGEVLEVGSNVASLSPGDRVVGADYTACGRCWWCRAGRHWHCPDRLFFGTGTTFGPSLAGAQAELVRVPYAETCLRALPDTISSVDAMVLGDTLATGYAASGDLRSRPGDVVAVVGGGPVGQFAAQCAQLRGAAHVVLVEPVAARRELGLHLGSVPATPDQAGEIVRNLTDGRGADGVIDAVGAPAGLEVGLSLLRRAGGLVSVGVPAATDFLLQVADAFDREITVGFAIGDFIRDGDQLVSLLASGLVPAADLLDSGFTLDGAVEAYDAMRERRTTKAVMKV